MKSPLKKLEERGWDSMGHGDYGMPRGGRRHKGWDIVGEPGEYVHSPITGVVTKYGYMYSFALQFRYIQIENETYRCRLGYSTLLDNVKVGDQVNEGSTVGLLQDIAGYWDKGMKNHLHVEVYKNGLLTDPEPLLRLCV